MGGKFPKCYYNTPSNHLWFSPNDSWFFFSMVLINWEYRNLIKKRTILERNGMKCGPLGQIFTVYRVLSTVKCSGSVWFHSVHFLFSTTLYPCSKTADHRPNKTKLNASVASSQCMQDTVESCVQAQSPIIRLITNFCQPCISKTAGRIAKRTKICALGASILCILHFLRVQCSGTAWVHLGYFHFSINLYLEIACHKPTQIKIWASRASIQYIHGIFYD